MRWLPVRSRGLIVLGVIPGLLVMSSAAAVAASISTGKTSQHGVVRIWVVKPRIVAQLIIELRTRCTDHRRRAIWPGFLGPFQGPGAGGRLSDSYDIVGRDIGTRVSFRQRASFTAQLTGNTLIGSAGVTQTFLATGVICRSPRVTFSVGL
jgi:hypothetical protein